MTVPIVIPSTPPADNSPSSEGGDHPQTPISPNMQATSTDQARQQSQASQQAANGTGTAPSKRKPSRRANTAERRATHNAVERQRRETLNGRFLDLAALLPNLSQIRRPSKSSIVNSSIAHIHASRRHRLTAARELRLVKLEADALRRELNEWRDRAGIPRVEEPIRGEGFAMILSGELEPITSVAGEEEEDEAAGQGYGGYGGDDDDYMGNGIQQMMPSPIAEDFDDHHRLAMLKSAAAAANPFAHGMPAPPSSTGTGILSHMLSRSAQPGMPFDAAPMGGLYDQPSQFPSQFMHHGPGPHHSVDPEKLAAWNLYNQQQQHLLQAQRSLFTPPATSHGLPSPNGNGNNAAGSHGSSDGSTPSGNPFNDPSSQAFLVNLQRHQMMQQHGNNNGHGFNGSDRDDASSVGSVPRGDGVTMGGGRPRSGSVLSAGSGSGYTGSPPHHGHGGGHDGASPVGSYELGSGGNSGPGEQFSAQRRTAGWGRDVVDMGGVHHGHAHHGHHAHAAMGHGMLPSPISAGGHGGGGGGFGMMM